MISSHILDELAKVADCFGIINEGILLDEFTAEELHQRCGQYILIRTDDSEGAVRALQGIGVDQVSTGHDGTLRITGHLEETADMAKAIVNAGIALKELHIQTVSLEDYYLGVTGGGRHNG